MCNVLRDGELGEVVANHFRLDFDLVELLSGVDTNDGSDHLWDDNHVTEVGLDEVWLLVGLGLLLRLAELLDQTHWLALETTVEPTTGAGVDDIAELLGGEVEESMACWSMSVVPGNRNGLHSLVEVNTTVRELSERSLSL